MQEVGLRDIELKACRTRCGCAQLLKQNSSRCCKTRTSHNTPAGGDVGTDDAVVAPRQVVVPVCHGSSGGSHGGGGNGSECGRC